jgi:RHH-type transcriptional regulator, proline utilization regulon repressor / proline dehydrogenase / delta 1-pyrroline-5-carboxylate dehydrogenase
MAKVLPQVPKILKTENQGWNYYFYEEFKDLFTDFQNDPLAPFREIQSNPFRIQISFKTVTFLVGVFYAEKQFRFYTPRLNHELFLLNNLEGSSEKDFLDFRDHTKKIAILSPKEFPSQIEINTKIFKLENLENEEKYLPIEKETNHLIEKLLSKMNQYHPSILEKLSDVALGLAARYSLIRIHLLKFLAILPSLEYDQSGKEIKRILLETLRRLQRDNKLAISENKKGQDRHLPVFLIGVLKVINFFSIILPPGILATLVKFNVKFMAKRFIAGETIESGESSLEQIYKSGRDVTLDQLGELVVSEKEADQYQDEVIKLIQGFSLYVKKGEKNKAGINRAHVSIKVSALCSDFKPHAKSYTYDLVAPRLKKILLEAKAHDVFINIDAEHIHYRDIVFYVYRRVLLETDELKNFSATGIVLQAYLRDSYPHFLEILDLAKERKILMPVRLVKGAYWDAETIEANAIGHEAPQFLNKEETDINFRQMAEEILKVPSHLQLCLASHNFADHCYAETLRKKLYSNAPVIEHQCLHMTYEALSTALAEMGYPVRNYVPVGSLLVGMAYLVRRIMENSSQVGILTIMRSHKNLKKIQTPEKILKKNKGLDELKKDISRSSMTGDFINVPPVRIYLPNEAELAQKALEDFRNGNLNDSYHNALELNGETFKIVSNSNPNIVLGEIRYANRLDTEKTIQLLKETYFKGDWSEAPWINRASCLLKAARIMVAKRNYLASLMVYEGGKVFTEALADVDEAIDFLTFYAHEEQRIQKENPKIEARGVIGVISPWNFPIAIPCGMVTSALVAGNSVILKSARPTPLIAQKLIDILHEANIPKNVVAHLPGKGSDVGEAIVQSPDIGGIVFTGSKAVGLTMAHKASKRFVKNKDGRSIPAKIIAEMGGKNAIIVTSNAELDESVAGILYSAFGHSGQKCSAASRILVDLKIKDKLIERLKSACLDLRVGEAFKFSSTMNPVITVEERDRLRKDVVSAVEEAKKYGGFTYVDRSMEDLPGTCMGPVLIELPSNRASEPDSFAYRELFGPVIHVIGYKNLDEAIKLFNSTEYALTGGLFSQSQDDIDYLTKFLESGNIYINRGITGARVAIEPFGGFKLSGTGPKAGGKSYVPSFHIAPLNLPEEIENIKVCPPNEEGESYVFDLCLSSSLEEKELRIAFDEGMEKLNQNFENLFDGIYGNQKEVLLKLKEYVDHNLKDYKNKKIPNREIPGQLSYNNLRLAETKVVVVAFEQRAYFSTLVHVLTALSMGIGVSVLARNQKAYDWWNKINSIFYKYRKDRSFDVFFPNQKLLESSLVTQDLRTIIVDGGEKEIAQIFAIVYDNSYSEKYMRQIITPLDSPKVSDFDSIVEKLVFVRSFAVNIMRHGAPMSVQ